jgi:hypothetical protein
MVPGRASLATGKISVTAFARKLLKQSRERDRVLGDVAGRDPTWEMLLHLLVSWEDEGVVSVPSLCRASGLPIATALRWLSVLEQAGKVLLLPGPTGRHQCHVELTSDAAEQLCRLLSSWMRD